MQWIEAIINISALAGFIGVANSSKRRSGADCLRRNLDRVQE
jgi:hypothetical protein